MTRSLTLALAFLALQFGSASASDDYPNYLRNEGYAARKPECSLCHVSGMTGYDSVHTPFGKSMRLRGLVAGDESSLMQALEQMRIDAVDSDDDGATDLEELTAGTDPNSTRASGYRDPEFGCSTAPTHDGANLRAGLLVALLAIFGAHRRATRHGRRTNA